MQRPIPFSAPMAYAVRYGIKTETRRLLRTPRQPPSGNQQSAWLRAQPGDTLLVQEPFRPTEGGVIYAGDPHHDHLCLHVHHVWQPARLLPRAMIRTRLRLDGIRIERLHDLTPAGAAAEGIVETKPGRFALARMDGVQDSSAVTAYARLWNSIHPAKPWRENPEVIVLTFSPLPADGAA